jgi:hypothetical protein
MKIAFNNHTKPQLGIGQHRVAIAKVLHGKSSIKRTPYFVCRFENQWGYLYQRFYITEGSKLFLKRFFEAASIYGNAVETKELLGKELFVSVETKDRVDFETGEIVGIYNESVSFWHPLEEELLRLNKENLIYNNLNT